MSVTTAPEQDTRAYVYGRLVREISVEPIREAVAAVATKLARRVPGIEIAVEAERVAWTDPKTGAPEPQYWCETHRHFTSSETHCAYGTEEYSARCYTGPSEIWDLGIYAAGLPTFDGDWTVTGVLTRDAAGVITASTVGPEDEREDGWAARHADLHGQCVHCGVIRKRTTTILLRNSAGEIKPVGKNCLGDYTGGMIRAEIVALLTSLGERFAEAIGGVLEREEATAPTVDVIALAMRYIARDGFVKAWSKGPKGEQATGLSLSQAFEWERWVASNTVPAVHHQPDYLPSTLTDADRQAAREAIAAILADGGTGDYVANLKAAAASEWTQVTGRRNKLGLLASLPGAAQRAREFADRQAAREAIEDARVNAWIGEQGQRRNFTGTITALSEHETEFGFSTLLVIDTAEGSVKVFGKIAGIDGYETGGTITLTGTITRHEEYREHKQTRINRVKIVP